MGVVDKVAKDAEDVYAWSKEVFRMKDYPLEVMALPEFECYNIACYMTKGHHDKQEFVKEVKTQYDADINIDWVHHSWESLFLLLAQINVYFIDLRKKQKIHIQ